MTDDELLFEACKKGGLNEVKRLLSRKLWIFPPKANANAKDRKGSCLRGSTPLHEAVSEGHEAIVAFLIRRGACVSAQNDEGRMPLHIAARNGRKDLVDLLVAKGADVNVGDDDGLTPLHHAAYSGVKDIAQLLINKGADVNAKDAYRRTPIRITSIMRHHEMTGLLRSSKAVEPAVNRTELDAKLDAKDKDGRTRLHRAVCDGTMHDVRDLLEEGAYPNVKDANGLSPLHYAVHRGLEHALAPLIAWGANSNAKDRSGATPLHIAIWGISGSQANSEFLIAKGANIDSRDASGRTPLHGAVTYDKKDAVEVLIAKGADVNVKDLYGDTLLHEAASIFSSKDIAELLIAKGLNVNAKNNDERTPLHVAAWARKKDVAELLITKGASINAKDRDGLTPLHFAGNKEVAELLIINGADVNAKDNKGSTPLQVAIDKGHVAVAEVLRTVTTQPPTESTSGNRQREVDVITCSKCGASYRLGVDAVAASFSDVLAGVGQVLALGEVPSNIPILIGRAKPETPAETIQQSMKKILSLAGKSGWCCEKCGGDHVNTL
jgi:ankyrin repeat protein